MKECIDVNKIKDYIEINYGFNVENVENVKSSYKIITENGGYCLKIIEYEFSHFYFILSAMKHLQKHEFKYIPNFILNRENKEYGKIGEYYAYLTEWVPSRVSNYDNPLELSKISTKLGELHECSKNFILTDQMKPRIGWFSWLNVFTTRMNEILDFEKRINQKVQKSKFDILYLENIHSEVERAEKSILGLDKNNYLSFMEKEVFRGGFCHHDYAHHNILVDDYENLNIIDFDYCILDSHLHDLSSLLIRAMKDGRWDKNKADIILESYKRAYDIEDHELPLIREFIRFPQYFWQLGIQVYWEQQSWGEEFFINKLQKYLNDVKEREEFIDTYFKGGD
ncbi:MAG: CotS family spore coat protein [Clostridium butyricum]|nr:CotS family spore coat protein [Clostridium butyricum]